MPPEQNQNIIISENADNNLVKTLNSSVQDLTDQSKSVNEMLTSLQNEQNSQDQKIELGTIETNNEITLEEQLIEASNSQQTEQSTSENKVNFFGVSIESLNASLDKIKQLKTLGSSENNLQSAAVLSIEAEEAQKSGDDLSSILLTIAGMIFGDFDNEDERNFALDKLENSFTRADLEGNKKEPTPENAKEFLSEALNDLEKPTDLQGDTAENEVKKSAESRLTKLIATYKEISEPKNIELDQNSEQELDKKEPVQTEKSSTENGDKENPKTLEETLEKWVDRQERNAQKYRPNLKQGAIDAGRYGAAVTLAVMVPGAGPVFAIAFLIMTKNQNQDKTLNPADLEKGDEFLKKSDQLRQELKKGRIAPIAAKGDEIKSDQGTTATPDQQNIAATTEEEDIGKQNQDEEIQVITPAATTETANNNDEIVKDQDELKTTNPDQQNTTTAAEEGNIEQQNQDEEIQVINPAATTETTNNKDEIVKDQDELKTTNPDQQNTTTAAEEGNIEQQNKDEEIQVTDSTTQIVKPNNDDEIFHNKDEKQNIAEAPKEEIISETAKKTTDEIFEEVFSLESIKRLIVNMADQSADQTKEETSKLPNIETTIPSQEALEEAKKMRDAISGDDDEANLDEVKAPVTPINPENKSIKGNEGR